MGEIKKTQTDRSGKVAYLIYDLILRIPLDVTRYSQKAIVCHLEGFNYLTSPSQ